MRVLRRAAGLQVEPACDGAQPQGEADPQLADTNVHIEVDPVELSIPAGETRSVNIVADLNSDLIGSWSVTVKYDPAVVTPVHCSGICNLAFAPDEVALANISANGIVLSSVVFEATGQVGEQSNLDLTAPDFVDTTGDRLSAILSDGTLTVVMSREDLDCRSGVTAQDALYLIYYIAGLPTTSHPSGCPALGE